MRRKGWCLEIPESELVLNFIYQDIHETHFSRCQHFPVATQMTGLIMQLYKFFSFGFPVISWVLQSKAGVCPLFSADSPFWSPVSLQLE